LNAWTALQFARSWKSSKGMRSARDDFHSFDCIPAPIGLRPREAPLQRSHRLVQSGRRSVGMSQNVIENPCIKPHFNVSSKIAEHHPRGVDQVLVRSPQRLHRDTARQNSTTRPRRNSGCHRYIPLKNSGSRIRATSDCPT